MKLPLEKQYTLSEIRVAFSLSTYPKDECAPSLFFVLPTHSPEKVLLLPQKSAFYEILY